MLDFQLCRALVKVDEISESIERTVNKDLLVFAEKYLLLLNVKNIWLSHSESSVDPHEGITEDVAAQQ